MPAMPKQTPPAAAPAVLPAEKRLYIALAEVAQMLGLSIWTVRKMLDEGELDGVYQRGRRYVVTESLRTYLANLSNVPA